MLSSVSLFVATPEQTIASRKRTLVEWGGGLTLEEYLDRDAVGEREEFGRDGKLMTWVLAPRNDPTTLDFFTSCETFKRQVAVSYPGVPEPQLELAFGYGIASIFTPPQHRGKGYARHMTRLLHWVLAREEYLSTKAFPEEEWGARPERVQGAGDGVVSALWSDVGPTMYTVCGMGVDNGNGEDGWVVREPISTVWEMKEVVVPEGDAGGYDTVWLDEKLAEETWREDSESIKRELVQSAQRENKAQFSFTPDKGVAAFMWFRLHYHFSRYIEGASKYCGVQIGSDGGTFATWTIEYRPGSPKTLCITRLRAKKGTIGPLMETVLRYAQRYGMEKTEVWNLAEELEAEVPIRGWHRVWRDEHISSIKWYGTDAVVWKNNEWFCWC